ncbi:MAG: glycosyltransferase family 2 protein [PVC group bacterium]|nr:glycosyltransferase family 2 protein [PVC group bacterium]
MEISVVIVTWNAQKFIRECLDSVFNQSVQDMEVIVVDNGSTDDTLNILNEFQSKILLIKNSENKGFCFANNQALRRVIGRYVLTLNSDIVLDNDYITCLKNHLVERKDVGMAQGKFLRMDRRTIDGLGLKLSWAKRLFNIAEGQIDRGQYDKQREIFGPCAAAALYKRELVQAVQHEGDFFDNSFFFLVEDFDVAWRAQKLGWKALYEPQAVCYHYRSSSDHVSLFKQYLSFRNRYFLLIKNADLKTFLIGIPYVFIYDFPRLLFLLFRNPYTVQALREIKELMPDLLKKRRAHVCRGIK